jgi:hypothetical protein
MSDEARVIDAVREALEVDRHFFSNKAKPERERWIVREFLSMLGIPFADDELISPPEADEVDVVFRDARFQVKEIYDPRVHRSDEIKENLRRANTANRVQDLYGKVTALDINHIDVFPLILEAASAVKYIPSRAHTDLLFYVTRTDATLTQQAQPPEKLRVWRSASCLFGLKPIILAAHATAPQFLKDR